MALDKKINELDPLEGLTDTDLVIIGKATDGRLFKGTIKQLKDFLSGTITTPANQLTRPIVIVLSATADSITIKVTGDSRTQQWVARLATSNQFAPVLRNATLTAPQDSYTFTGLSGATTFYIEIIAKASGLTDSVATLATAVTLGAAGSGFPYAFPTIF